MSAVPNDVIEADVESAALSDYDTENSVSSTASLSSSILEQTFKNGRRYHRKSDGIYFMPSDETELDRLDLVHHLTLNILDGELHTAPLEGRPLHNVLDCGTGTGIWALDFGEVHPETQVLGVDLAPLQPSWVFPNVRFETDDLEKEWLFKEKFDFIHARMIAVAIRDWDRFAAQMFKFTTPGGYVEIVEHALRQNFCDDGSAPPDSKIGLYMKHMSDSLETAGINVDIDGEHFKAILEKAGFVDVTITPHKYPLGTWPKDKKLKRCGRIMAEILNTAFEAYGIAAMTAGGKMTIQGAQEICTEAKAAVRAGKEHWYNIMYYVHARKPEDAK